MKNSIKYIDKAISELIDNFKENPLDFFTESDIVFRLYFLLQSDNMIASKTVKAKCKDKHRNVYLIKIAKKRKISLIHSEINLKEYENKRLDLGIFKDDYMLDYSFENGTKKWCPEDLSVAIEVKFIKKFSSLNCKLKKKFEEDIEKLNYCKDAAKYMLIFSNKNIFNNPEYENWLKEKKDENHINIRHIHP